MDCGLKVLIVGHSGTLGLLLPEPARLHNQLTEMLRERFPDQVVEVRTEPWRRLTDTRLAELIAEVERRQPDYLILQPVPFWVSFPLVDPSTLNGLLRRAYGLFDGTRKANFSFEQWILRHGPAPLIPVFDTVLRWVERCVFGARPLFTVPEAIAAMERLIGAAKRSESTDILLLSKTLEGRRNSMRERSRRSRYVRQRFTPREYAQEEDRFVSELLALSPRHHLTFIETGVANDHGRAGDGFHAGPASARQKAIDICAAIVRREQAYHLPGTMKTSAVSPLT
jgi:hypothetical protein